MSADDNQPNQSRDRWFLDTLVRIRATSEETSGMLSIIEQILPAGHSPPRHVHSREAAVLYVIEGLITVDVGGDMRRLRAGESVFLPEGVAHTFRAEVPSRLLEIATPGSLDAFYVANSTPAERLALPEPVEPDVAQLVAGAKRQGVDIVGPPMTADAVRGATVPLQ